MVVETIQFHPPKEFNSVEAAFAYKGKVDANDVISLLVYLAQKGYIEIVEGKKVPAWKSGFYDPQIERI